MSSYSTGPWRERLLPLPAFLLHADMAAGNASDSPRAGAEAVAQGLILTGYFLARHVFEPHGRPMPAARVRLAERIATSLRRLGD